VVVVAPHCHDEQVDGIRVKAVPQPTSRIERMLITSCKVFRAGISERADVYHFHDPELLIAGLALKIVGHKVIYDVHEDMPKTIENKYYIPGFVRGWVAFAANLLEKKLARVFDAIVPATDDIAKNFSGCRNVATVRNYPRFSTSGEIRRSEHHQGFRCAYVGVLSEGRGVSRIIQAMAKFGDLTDVELVLCGECSPSSYEEEIRRLPGFQRVDYHGWITPQAVPGVLSDADVGLVCIQPLDQYLTSLPTKLFEYMVAGLPVVASDFPLWKEIVEGNRCGVCVDPRDPAKIAEAIRYLRANPELRAEMGANGKRAALEHYNWETESRILLKVYAQVLNGHAGWTTAKVEAPGVSQR
jgi:glycosyltransferase involved in cell wall biosynthesis